jgi:hypothetical protein
MCSTPVDQLSYWCPRGQYGCSNNQAGCWMGHELFMGSIFLMVLVLLITYNKQTLWVLVRKQTVPTDAICRRNLVKTFVDRGVLRGQRGGSPTVVNLSFLDRSHYFSFKYLLIYPHKGWVDSVPDPLLLRKSVSNGNRTQDLWVCTQEHWPLDHRGGHINYIYTMKYKLQRKCIIKILLGHLNYIQTTAWKHSINSQ